MEGTEDERLRFAAIESVEAGPVYVGRGRGKGGVEVVKEGGGVGEVAGGLAAF